MSGQQAERAVAAGRAPRPQVLLSAALLLAAVLVVFAQTVSFEFVNWDDGLNVYQNPFLPLTPSNLLALWTRPYFMSYLPVAYTAWGGIAALAQLLGAPTPFDPAVFHLANVLLHAVNTLLVLALLRALTGAAWPALAGAALFALHPLQVEAVAWVSGFKDLLATCLGLLAILCYLRWALRAPADRWALGWYLAGITLYALALLSKPSAAAVPLVAWVLEVLALRRPVRAATLALAPWLALAVPAALVLREIDPTAVLAAAHTPLWLRPLVAGDALAFYLGKLVLPRALVVDYGRTPQLLRASWWGYVTWLAPVALGYLLWRLRRYRWPLTAGALLVAGLLPTLGLIAIPFQEYSTVADRYMYLAMLGPALALSCLLVGCQSRPAALVVGLVLVLLGCQSALQAMHWRSSVHLFSHVLEINPRSWVAHGNLGVELANRGNVALGVEHLRRALQLRPDAYEPRVNYATVLRKQGREREALEQLHALVRYHPRHPAAHDYLAALLDQMGQHEPARQHWHEALTLNPNYAPAWHNLAVSYYRSGQVREAMAAWRAALRADPDYRLALQGLGQALREHPELR